MRLPPSLLEPVMHGRSAMMNKHSEIMDALHETSKPSETAVQSDKTHKENHSSVSESFTSPLSNSTSHTTSQSSYADEDCSVNSKCTSDIETMSLSSSPFSHQSDTASPHAYGYASTAEVSADYSHSATDEMLPASSLPSPYHNSVLLQDGLSTSTSLLDFASSSLMHAHSDYNSLHLTDTTMCGSDTESPLLADGLGSTVQTDFITLLQNDVSHVAHIISSTSGNVLPIASLPHQAPHFTIPQASPPNAFNLHVPSNLDLSSNSDSLFHPTRHQDLMKSCNNSSTVSHSNRRDASAVHSGSNTGIVGTSLPDHTNVEHNLSTTRLQAGSIQNSKLSAQVVPQGGLLYKGASPGSVPLLNHENEEIHDILQQFL